MMTAHTQQEEDASQLKLGPDFDKAKCLFTAEVYQKLEDLRVAAEEGDDDDAKDRVQEPMFQNCLVYSQRYVFIIVYFTLQVIIILGLLDGFSVIYHVRRISFICFTLIVFMYYPPKNYIY